MLQYTGDAVDAAEAYRLGMVNSVVPHDELMKTTMELAGRLAKGPTYSMSDQDAGEQGAGPEPEDHLIDAGRAQGLARRTGDHKEGVRAFWKRQPLFKGR
ncbi:MAG: enoyl-CoA hydratase-related protein [Dehalococcoidia bacterium]